MIILQKAEDDKKIKAAERKTEIEREIRSQEKTRIWALVTSGSYLLDCHIEYVVPLTNEEKSKYRADFAKNNLYKLAIKDERTSLEKIKRESKIVQKIQDRKSNGYLAYGESVVWLITDAEKTDILIEKYRHAEKERKAKEAKAKEKSLKLSAYQEQAKNTGEPVVMYSYVTSECMNGGHDCSFDTATVYMLPSGTQKTTYTCCH
ncbi:hypothetical protein KA005_07450 [bacterium]|nr:hypothetical protein [bacterium]